MLPDIFVVVVGSLVPKLVLFRHRQHPMDFRLVCLCLRPLIFLLHNADNYLLDYHFLSVLDIESLGRVDNLATLQVEDVFGIAIAVQTFVGDGESLYFL